MSSVSVLIAGLQCALEWSSGLRLEHGRTSALLAQVRRLNAEVYGDELGQEPNEAAHAAGWVDETQTVLVRRGDHVVGMVGLTLPGSQTSLEKSCDLSSWLAAHRHEAVEVRRLAVSRAARRGAAWPLLALAILRFFVEHRARFAVFSAVSTMKATYEEFGARTIGPAFRKGTCDYSPMLVRADAWSAFGILKSAAPRMMRKVFAPRAPARVH